ncbi:MAG TPA: PEP-CTERM sorting domain-containing protein [Verrucomicrobiae bacterium]|jgi:hypothetical protein|nr:PEP-CTERM sorting domain-containing protein [Verrucomicrobiae bacterium]
MKIVKPTLLNFVLSFFLSAAVTASAQTTWNYFISDAGDGSSLVTWNVTGNLTLFPEAPLSTPGSSLALAVTAPGIFAQSYSSSGALQNLPNPDGSYFAYGGGTVYAPIAQYIIDTAAGDGNQSFGLAAPLLPKTLANLVYNPGTQSVVIPVPFYDFNPGTWQSVDPEVTTPLTVNLIVVPEPSTLALAAVAGVLGVGVVRKRFGLKSKSRAA